ncbi:MAG: RNA polymerase sigma-70 factor, ECF subfamily [Parcubacteria group bacterium Gr01-1014_48]|nr:MAG: RNA polymerase sigma-70 factor, ECF subfamily [Parcubacteria group bacterium Greene0416_14]TSC74606.1 MAG: RNA polymerase sigma-70 factor, ECF subfamily [Parcubacteria group bacterium Gr01-1014_48]TSD01595.1 MAG: RNA polymerase sigma-70 factor, ECF subfamily [Parcubacteria group bacterium Greene1014_15]TSD08356.1 MAG: RNA polymerase sigma-70 factor, ECF subfamily [Parcubacteria group bacterium Greene0714_4]
MTREEQNMVLLIQQARGGDQEAFGKLYALYFTPIYRYVYVRIGVKHDVDDITQTVFLKAWQAMARYENQGKPFLAWLFTIARNTVYDYRKKKRDILFDDTPIRDESISLSPRNEEKELYDEQIILVRKALLDLSQDQQDVIALRFIEGRSYREISSLIEKSQDAVRAIASRGLRELRKKIGRRVSDEPEKS